MIVSHNARRALDGARSGRQRTPTGRTDAQARERRASLIIELVGSGKEIYTISGQRLE